MDVSVDSGVLLEIFSHVISSSSHEKVNEEKVFYASYFLLLNTKCQAKFLYFVFLHIINHTQNFSTFVHFFAKYVSIKHVPFRF